MPGIVFDEIEAYIDGLADRGDAALQAVEEQGRKEDWPIVGPAEGSLLHILAKSVRARRVLELGTAIGYSGTWLARALPADGELVTVEWNPETEVIREYNRRLAADARFIAVIVPLRDGVSIALKVRD